MRIYIKGFKSIADGQYVALGKKLTFLVGPNSAGKSVVFHALKKLNGHSPLFEPEDELIHHNISKDKIATSQALGIEWVDGEETIEYRATMFDSNHYAPYEKNSENIFSNSLEFQEIDESENPTLTKRAWAISRHINDEITTNSIFAEKTFSNLHTWNTTLINFNGRPKLAEKIDPIIQWLYDLFSNPGNQQSNLEASQWIKKNIENGVFDWDEEYFRFMATTFSGKERQHHLNQLGRFKAKIHKIVENEDQKFIQNYPGKRFDIALVSADRVLPTNEDSCALLDPDFSSNNIYHDLMRSFVAKEWGCNSAGIEQTKNTEQPTASIINYHQYIAAKTSDSTTQLASDVNRHLSESLFIDIGYQLSVKSYIRLTKFQIENNAVRKLLPNDENRPDLAVKSFKFDARMSLIDANGLELDFTQIGSGIGYVLPVLIECLHPKNKDKIVFIQQPELHLHPALQASLCDVLIEAGFDRMIVSETHSEHLILRALRRMRQTFNGSLISAELELNPDDVAINYFEPQGDGSTRIHIMRVAPDGEFIDRWPNGFFPEREQELFDE